MQDSKIEWTDHTFNPWAGCTKVSPGCHHCYAETLMDKRYGKVEWGPQGKRIRTSAAYWKQPLRWNRLAEAEGVRRRVFCASLADVFEDKADQRKELDEWRRDLLNLIMKTPWLDWLLLTKRPENIRPLLRRIPVLKRDNVWDHLWDNGRCQQYFPNVWLGTSVENQERADERIPLLLEVPAAVRFLSCEPLLGPVDLSPWLSCDTCLDRRVCWCGANLIDWVIVGGESGPNARPMNPDWARSLRNQCVVEAGVPYFYKQTGEWTTDYPGLGRRKLTFQHGKTYYKVGKKLGGRLLDGREWNEFPTAPAAPATTTARDR